jgi:hypothetical protein
MTPLRTVSTLLVYIKFVYATNEHYAQEGLKIPPPK